MARSKRAKRGRQGRQAEVTSAQLETLELARAYMDARLVAAVDARRRAGVLRHTFGDPPRGERRSPVPPRAPLRVPTTPTPSTDSGLQEGTIQ